MTSYTEAVNYLYSIPKFTKKAPLQQTKDYFKLLGIDTDVERRNIIHVAGTNGKGSVCAFTESMLRSSGYSTGLFTSPHLVKPEERIRINGIMISEEDFLTCFRKAYCGARKLEESGKGHPTFFSFILAMGMLSFLEHNVDYIILETGLGGRLDGTNVFKNPGLTVITSIGLDHTEYLGSTREEIAAEKAGIIKTGVPVIFPEDEVTAPIIRRQAQLFRAPCRSVDMSAMKIIKKTSGGIDFSFGNGYDDTDFWHIPFPAEYQVENAALAVSAMEVLFTGEKEQKLPKTFHCGLAHARWEGRMEEARRGVYFDGGHNVPGVRALLLGMNDLAEEFGGRRILLFSAVKDKEYRKMAEILMEGFHPDILIFTEIPGERGVPLDELSTIWKGQDTEIFSFPEIKDAYVFALKQKTENDFLLCTGSLYLIGALKEIESNAGERQNGV